MKKLFFLSILGLILFEVANVYFIMPMPGSQKMDSIGLAYFLYSWRWVFRLVLGGLTLGSLLKSGGFSPRWLPLIPVALWAAVVYMFNFEMTADHMFIQPRLDMKNAAGNKVDSSRIVIGIASGNEARAYPIQFMAYHHQVRDTLAGNPVMVTYCNVCRSGRVFEPKVNGVYETFRLVGMDHFNAMFEDSRSKSWWRQENGEAVAGPLKGQSLPELPCQQMSLAQWLKLHPHTLIMQADPAYQEEYDQQTLFETGKKRSKLTGTDSLSWREKSWVIGMELNGISTAFDWNELKVKRVMNERVGETPVVVFLAQDTVSFAVFERPAGVQFTAKGDSLCDGSRCYDLAGRSPGDVPPLKKVQAYQEFWHSWRTFN